ncbi:UNKNOWN [Stylonychia lemnae]|uniref:Reticulon-like protein n=1 Tax=Stylonychia lemnae TaxID=5949 RepID=A0A078B5T2_STYLE|nr:UNKNOWN [Stylonychia lemnae]|eukprot:CDW88667.1 UNKNOWN [Stylonychia lemnae]
MLMMLYKYSLMSLILLFSLFISIAGMALNQIYLSENEVIHPQDFKSTNDEKQYYLEQEDQQEYVSAETVQDMIVKLYSLQLRVHTMVEDVFSLNNMKLTIKVLISMIAMFLITYVLSDVAFIWIAVNIMLFWPFIHKKKEAQIDSIVQRINDKIDNKVQSSGFLMRRQQRAPSSVTELKKNQ